MYSSKAHDLRVALDLPPPTPAPPPSPHIYLPSSSLRHPLPLSLPTQELRSFEKWLARGGVWAAQPALAMLTTCGSTAPRGLKAGAGGDNEAAATRAGEFVSPSDYPTDEALSEMVDPYEALICWFYPPAGSGTRGGCKGSGRSANEILAAGKPGEVRYTKDIKSVG